RAREVPDYARGAGAGQAHPRLPRDRRRRGQGPRAASHRLLRPGTHRALPALLRGRKAPGREGDLRRSGEVGGQAVSDRLHETRFRQRARLAGGLRSGANGAGGRGGGMKDRHSRHQGIVLSNREVVALGVGSLVVLGVVFYLGVSVGKGLAPAPEPEPRRTLEVLDQQAEAALGMDLTFPETLTKEDPRPAEREAPAPRESTKKETPKPQQEKVAEAREPERPKEPEPRPTEPKAVEASARFTVQLASFPNREEADAFVARVREAGLSPRIVEAEIPGKGTYYRVRVGAF